MVGCVMHMGGVHVVEMCVNLRGKIETGSLSVSNDLV